MAKLTGFRGMNKWASMTTLQLVGIDLPIALNSEPMATLRANIRAGRRPECKTCVCSMWRDPENIGESSQAARFASEASA